MFLVPLVLTLVLALMSFLPRVSGNPILIRSFWGAAAVLLVWLVVLFLRVRGASEGRSFSTVLRPQHYIQALIHVSVFTYWGFHWRPVYEFAWLLVAQLMFAYAFDMLLAWTRRENYVLGFGPLPIIFSTNLFLWFHDDWFYLQFLMLAVGFMGKEFVRWQRDGRRVHIFNPSAFSLGLFSLVLIATNTTNLTWGQEIASTLTLAPYIYSFLFVLGLIVMYFFSITLVAASAAIMLFSLSAVYGAVTGVPYFVDSEIPSAVFLGLHLLITDPSTSPRTPLGKSIFGGLYGLGVFALYALLGALGVPTFYDKLLCVPLLNLSVRRIDSLVRAIQESPQWGRWRQDWAPAGANWAHMSVWIVFFGAMTALGRTDGSHTGDSLPFWQQACEEGRRNACDRLIQLESTYCGDNSGWACNELGGHFVEGRITQADPELATAYFSRACEVRFQAGCVNVLNPESPSRAPPRIIDLQLLLREGGQNLIGMSEPDLYARARDHGWTFSPPLQRGPELRSQSESRGNSQSRGNMERLSRLTATLGNLSGFRSDAWFLPDEELLGFVQVPGGPFVMGSDPAIDRLAFDNESWPGASPQETLDLPSFYVGRYEVTVAQFGVFVEETGYRADDEAFQQPPDHPVAAVSWTDALAYARWLETTLREWPETPPELSRLLREGWRISLPTEAEWEKAARGSDGRIYPWGNEPRRDRANYQGRGTAPVGSFECPECPFGLLDMSGNVWELTRSPYQAYPYDESDDREGLDADALWVMRGGAFNDPERNVRTAIRGGADPGVRRPFIGFRLVITRF